MRSPSWAYAPRPGRSPTRLRSLWAGAFGHAPLVLALTFPIGVGMGLAGALMPVAVKERFAHRPAFASGVYTTGINLGSALSSALAVPLAAAFGGWRAALAVFSACTIMCFAAWLFLTPPVRGERAPGPPPPP